MKGGKSNAIGSITIIDVGLWLSRFVFSLLVPLAIWFCRQIDTKLTDFDQWQRKADTKLALIESSSLRSQELLVETKGEIAANRADIKAHESRLSKVEYGCCAEKK